MRLLKLALGSLVVFGVVITLISLFFPSHVRVSKAIDIKASRDSIVKQLNDPTNWKNWYPNAENAAMYRENGKLKGIQDPQGNALVIVSASDTAITTANVGLSASKSSGGWLIHSSSPGLVTVQWFTDFKLKWYPWEKFSSLLLEKRYGPLMEQGLEKLKKYAEQRGSDSL